MTTPPKVIPKLMDEFTRLRLDPPLYGSDLISDEELREEIAKYRDIIATQEIADDE